MKGNLGLLLEGDAAGGLRRLFQGEPIEYLPLHRLIARARVLRRVQEDLRRKTLTEEFELIITLFKIKHGRVSIRHCRPRGNRPEPPRRVQDPIRPRNPHRNQVGLLPILGCRMPTPGPRRSAPSKTSASRFSSRLLPNSYT